MEATAAVPVAVREVRERNEARCRRILASPAPLRTDDLAWETVGDVELHPQVVTSLVYMRDVEGFTPSYLNGLGAHRTTLSDPLIRQFLDRWVVEEAGHAAALDEFLQRYGKQRSLAIPERQPAPPPALSRRERMLVHLGGPVGRVVATAHMAWGAANELLTLNGYRRLAARCSHPVLSELLTRIAAQEARHYSFYLLQAEWRLAASRLHRAVLPRIFGSWTPVGVGEGYKEPSEFAPVLAYLGTGAEGRRMIDRMDRRFAALPGLGSLRIFRGAASTFAAM